MELTRRELSKWQKELQKCKPDARIYRLEQLLQEQPYITISVIHGYDNFSYEAYIKAAYFFQEKAEQEMRKIKPNGTGGLSDSYHIEAETAEKCWRRTDRIDRTMIYEALVENIMNYRRDYQQQEDE